MFDEATSVLDVSTERAVLASVASFHSHQTTMVNSLRIKSIVWVGSFVLLDQGRIVATGTSDLPFEEWTEVFGSERLAGALLDRLTHDVHILEMNRDSYRLNQSRQKLPRLQTAEPSPLNALRGSKWSARTAAKNLSRRMLVSLLAPFDMQAICRYDCLRTARWRGNCEKKA